MREKTDARKRRDGRGIITEERYEAWKTVREAKSSGTAYAVYDPIQQRTVNLLSQGEKAVFWALRFEPRVDKIYEQFPLDRGTVDAVCDCLGYKAYQATLSTDFLVTTPEKVIAISSKPGPEVYDPSHRSYSRMAKRLQVEKMYWEDFYGIEFQTVFSNTINRTYVQNIRDVMCYYDPKWITDTTGLLMHMIARHILRIPQECMERERIPFRAIANQIDTEGMYAAYQKHQGGPELQGWFLDLHGRNTLPDLKPLMA